MRLSKVVRRGNGRSAVNAVVVANVGDDDSTTVARSRQHVEIIQRDGHTEVREHHDDDDREAR
jgi:hypothetical protein